MLALLVSLLLSGAPESPYTPAPPILGVRLGASAADTVAERGDPLKIDGDAGLTRYHYLYGTSAFEETVTIAQGRVHGIELQAIPDRADVEMRTFGFDGLRIGDPLSAVQSMHGEDIALEDDASRDWLILKDGYGLHAYVKDGRVVRLYAGLGHQEDLRLTPSFERPKLHGGTSYQDAIVIVTDNIHLAHASETYWASAHSCASNAQWIPHSARHEQREGSAYDVVPMQCPVGKSTRTVYFLTRP